MTYLFFFLYLIILCWLVTKLPFFRSSIFKSYQLILLFLAKLVAGFIYGYIFKPIPEADTWRLFSQSVEETAYLYKHPVSFFVKWVYDPSYDYLNPFSDKNSYWNDLRDLMVIKPMALLNVLSFSNYYINVLFYTFLTFFGCIAFTKAYNLIFPGARKLLLTFTAFFIPSTFFWTSGMHKDGLIFMLICFIAYQLSMLFNQKTSNLKAYLKIAVCLFFILLLRNYVALLLIPSIFICVSAFKYPAHAYKILTFTLLVGAAAFFLSQYLPHSFNLPEWLVKRRVGFYELEANTKLPINELKSTFSSFLTNFPEAFNHGFLRPYLWEGFGLRYIPFAIELILLLIMVFYALFCKITYTTKQRAFFLFGVFLLFSTWLFLGYIVHIVGAIVRYKSIFLPFFVAPILLAIPGIKLIKK